MEYRVTSSDPVAQSTACLVLGVHEGGRLLAPTAALDQASGGYLSRAMSRAGFSGERGQTLLLLDVPAARAGRVLLIGCGKDQRVDARRFRSIVLAAARAVAASSATKAICTLAAVEVRRRDLHWKVRQLVEAQEAHAYRFDQFKSKPKAKAKPKPKLKQLTFSVASRAEIGVSQRACAEAVAVAGGVAWARDLGNLPGNICTPTYLAEQARSLAAGKAVNVRVLNESDMDKLGMGALLAVTRGSREAAKLIVVEHRRGPTSQKPVVLVGKGVTFDSGGISLKSAGSMDKMKFDMCGAAGVLGAMKACASLDLPLNVIAIIAAVENMPGGAAVKPGDIVTSMSGKSIEILNTDAEGRLILCDALTFAHRYEPDVVIDVATLTGACVVALGKYPHGLFSNSRSLSKALESAGRSAHDRPWPMPLWEEYFGHLDSNFADMANVGGSDGGAVVAACFLARFVRRLRWAHLDIAGTAWRGGSAKGATGRPVPLLTQFLLDRVAAGRSDRRRNGPD